MRRRFRLSWTLLALLSALVFAPPALADGAMVEIDDVSGLIYAADDARILFRLTDTAFGLRERDGTEVTTVMPAPGRAPVTGYLTPHGALLVTHETVSPFQYHLEELYEGLPRTDHGAFDGDSLQVAGNFAEYSVGSNLIRRDLTVPPPGGSLTVAVNASNTGNDVAANGDVVYSTASCDGCPTEYGIARYRNGLTEVLAVKDGSHWHGSPRTDGINVVWDEFSPCCAPESGSIRAHGPDGPFTLANTLRSPGPAAGPDYRVAGGYIAFTRGDRASNEIWLRDKVAPFTETEVASGGNLVIAGLGEDGQVVFAKVDGSFPNPFFLYRPGSGVVPLGTVPPEGVQTGARAAAIGGSTGGVFQSGGHWYLASGRSLLRFATDQAPEPGSQTTIVSGPVGTGNSAHATFAFSSSVAGATFECKLDGAAYEPCASPKSYAGLGSGQHTLAVRSVDSGGKRDPDPAIAAWVVEDDPPVVTLADPPALTADRTPHFEGTAGTAPEDGDVTVKVFRKDEATPLRTVVATRTGASWSADATPEMPDGEYTVRAEQRDEAGNVGTSSVKAFRLDSTPPGGRPGDTTPPGPSLSFPNPVLTGREVTFTADAIDESPLVRFEWDLDGDGDFERDTGTVRTTRKTYATPHVLQPAVRVTDAAGNVGVSHSDALTVAPVPPPGRLGITINDAARFTNDPNVFVSPVWHPGETEVLLSNDGGFRDAVTAPLATNIPWRLDSSGPERLPKTVYARLNPDGPTYTDDIILDETPPAFLLAVITAVDPRVSKAATRKRTYHLHLKARDRTAGVNRLQITTNRARPGKARPFRNHPTFRASTSKIYVRARDRARNWSRWKRCKVELGAS